MSKELRDILARVRQLGPDDQAVLATVVSLEGSGYRLPGARMLIAHDGTVIGTVSGGCLEADLLERAQAVFATGKPDLITYDTRGHDDSVFSLNMGCNGVLKVLLEPVEGNDLFALIEQVFTTRQPITLATVIASDDPAHPIGERIAIDNDSEATHCSPLTAPSSATAYCPLPTADYFVETIRPPLNLVVFGAGFDAVPVVRLANELGWHITVVDHRPAYLDAERLSHPDELLNLRPDELAANLQLGPDSAAVVMTHNFEHDREILRFLLTQPVQYLGALGPKARTTRILADLTAAGNDVDAATVTKLHAPIGLDIGAQTPESIALSIIAEIQAVVAERDAGHLKDRQAPIYERKQSAVSSQRSAGGRQ
ncbi:MAG: XdhC family protein [Pyrinomonadaceae bacterium]